MPITHYVTTDIFALPHQTITCPVNTVGVMGAGLALAFSERYPTMARQYRRACQTERFEKEGVITMALPDDRQVLLFPTKHHWREKSDLALIEFGLQKLAENYEELGIKSLAMVPLGCGMGKLKFRDVEPLLIKYLQPLPFPTTITRG